MSASSLQVSFMCHEPLSRARSCAVRATSSSGRVIRSTRNAGVSSLYPVSPLTPYATPRPAGRRRRPRTDLFSTRQGDPLACERTPDLARRSQRTRLTCPTASIGPTSPPQGPQDRCDGSRPSRQRRARTRRGTPRSPLQWTKRAAAGRRSIDRAPDTAPGTAGTGWPSATWEHDRQWLVRCRVWPRTVRAARAKVELWDTASRAVRTGPDAEYARPRHSRWSDVSPAPSGRAWPHAGCARNGRESRGSLRAARHRTRRRARPAGPRTGRTPAGTSQWWPDRSRR